MPVPMRVGATVRVPWGLDHDVEGTIVEVWGNPPTQVRVQLHLDADQDEGAEPVVILLSPAVVRAA